jgi:hypothetical protein
MKDPCIQVAIDGQLHNLCSSRIIQGLLSENTPRISSCYESVKIGYTKTVCLFLP